MCGAHAKGSNDPLAAEAEVTEIDSATEDDVATKEADDITPSVNNTTG